MNQQYEYKIIDYQRPYKDYLAKVDKLNNFAKDGWELICTSIIPMGISDDRYTFKWLCTECGNTIPSVNSELVPRICINKKCEGVTFERITSISDKVWCIEHLYLRREIEEGEEDEV